MNDGNFIFIAGILLYCYCNIFVLHCFHCIIVWFWVLCWPATKMWCQSGSWGKEMLQYFQSINTSMSIFCFRYLASSILLPMDLEPTFYTMTIRQHLQNCNENWNPRSSGNSLQVLKKPTEKIQRGCASLFLKTKIITFWKSLAKWFFLDLLSLRWCFQCNILHHLKHNY